ncbi:MAG: hemerythrin domain-containing protein [Epsilonproteobacteria bacterium]|nr:hemerythrin domain-containing protein [Campylobacterota bacterium]
MFGWFKSDPTARKKEVKRWKKEHAELAGMLEKINNAYERGNDAQVRLLLKEFGTKVVEHLLSEDTVFYEIQRSANEKDPGYADTMAMIAEFRESFGGAKAFVMKFLSKYTAPDAKYDREFKEAFDTVVKALSERIMFEESQYYAVINH